MTGLGWRAREGSWWHQVFGIYFYIFLVANLWTTPYFPQNLYHNLVYRSVGIPANHCSWQVLWAQCTKMHTSETPPTPCFKVTYYCWVAVYSPSMRAKTKMVRTTWQTPGVEQPTLGVAKTWVCPLCYLWNRTRWVVLLICQTPIILNYKSQLVLRTEKFSQRRK